MEVGRSLNGTNTGEASGEIDQVAIDYKLKLIAFQDELFKSRKKLQDSDRKMAELQKKMEEYIKNKENQISEVMFTAHMNAQRIEAQTRSQTEYIIRQMEEEMRRKEKELGLIQKKTSSFADEIQPDNVDLGNKARLQVVQDNIRAFRDQMETNEIMNVPPKKKKTATKKSETPAENQEQVIKLKKADEPVKKQESMLQEPIIDKPVENQEQTSPAAKAGKTAAGKKRLVVAKKADKKRVIKKDIAPDNREEPSRPINDQIISTQEPEHLQEVPKQSENMDFQGFEAQEVFAGSKTEPNERMRLDAFVDARYYVNIAGQKQMQNHALQVTIEVDVPDDNYSVRYTKVSSDVVSNLMHYDSVVLNEIYPFNIIEPNPQNIAMYFYNSLEDMLSLMDLELHSLILLELPDLQIKVNTRNTKLDSFLHQDEDMLGDIRNSLIPCVESFPEDNASLKGTLNRILKKRN